MKMTKIKTHEEALTLGLWLAINAPTEEQAEEATEMCERLTRSMTTEQVERCMAAAEVNDD